MASKILIIDDSKLVVVMLKDGLSKEGYEISTASDGLEGLHQVQKVNPDLIVLDRHMPVMGADEFMEELKKARGNNIPPVILLTGSEPLDEELVPPPGVDRCLQKPVHISELSAAIKACLKDRSG